MEPVNGDVRDRALDAADVGAFVWHIEEDRFEGTPRAHELLTVGSEGPRSFTEILDTLADQTDAVSFRRALLKASRPNGVRRVRQDLRLKLPGGDRVLVVRGEIDVEGDPVRAVRLTGLVTGTATSTLHDERRRFITAFADTLRHLEDPIAVQSTAAHLLGTQLGASRAFYAESLEDGTGLSVRTDYIDGVASMVGEHRWEEISRPGLDNLHDGTTWVCEDWRDVLTAESRRRFDALQIVASVFVPVLKRGALSAALVVQQRSPRAWTEHEVRLIEDVAEHAWAAVERARAEQKVRTTQAKDQRDHFRVAVLADVLGVLETGPSMSEAVQLLLDRLVPALADRAIAWLTGDDGTEAEIARAGPPAGPGHMPAAQEELLLDAGGGSRVLVRVDFDELGNRPHSAEDVEFIRDLAHRIEVNLLMLWAKEEEHRGSISLQRALLPGQILQHPEVAIAARYEARSELLEVGGDWYDTFLLPSGLIAVAAGDVVGHGLVAAAAMGKLRVAAAALAQHATGPGHLLALLDQFLASADGAPFATACYATFDPATGELRYASAGHPPLLVIDVDGRPQWLVDGRSGPLVRDGAPARPEAHTMLDPGALVVLYSDGLFERRGELLSDGLERLQHAAIALRDRPVEEICDQLMETMGVSETRDDDVVVLCLRAPDRIVARFRRTLPGQAHELRFLGVELREWTSMHGLEPVATALVLAVREAAANAVEHAYSDGQPGVIDIAVDLHERGILSVMVRDFGKWRAPRGTAAQRRASGRGRGTDIIRQLTTRFGRVSDQHGTTVSFELPSS